jgi:predicted nucleic acid-binding protein
VGDHILDCCSLLNLYTGWAGLEELRELKTKWHICDAVYTETEYSREYDAVGDKIVVPLDIGKAAQSGSLRTVRPETDAEFEDYVSFAMEIDDGEAQAIAIAKHRNFILLTDDRRAARFAARSDIAVRTTSTPNVLNKWAGLSVRNEARLYEIIPRIADLAKYSPTTDSPLYLWWQKYVGTNT